MWARTTRLEFIIVSVALLVLLMCSSRPKSGNADVSDFHAEDLASASFPEQAAPGPDPGPTDGDIEKALPVGVSEPLPPDIADETDAPPEAPRIAAVDARSCDRLEYKDVMYGQVTVRWVWNGTKFVPHKVCVVEEEGGVSSVWSFDQQEEAVLSELSEQPDSPR